MNFKKFLFFLLLVLFTQKPAAADTTFFLDFKLILNESDAGKKAQNFLKNKLETGIKNIRQKEKNTRGRKKLLSRKKLFQRKNIKKVSDLRSKVSSLQKERNSLLETVAKQRNKAKNELLKNLNPIVKEYMKEKNIRMIVDKKSILLADDSLDITKDIMSLLNKKSNQ